MLARQFSTVLCEQKNTSFSGAKSSNRSRSLQTQLLDYYYLYDTTHEVTNNDQTKILRKQVDETSDEGNI